MRNEFIFTTAIMMALAGTTAGYAEETAKTVEPAFKSLLTNNTISVGERYQEVAKETDPELADWIGKMVEMKKPRDKFQMDSIAYRNQAEARKKVLLETVPELAELDAEVKELEKTHMEKFTKLQTKYAEDSELIALAKAKTDAGEELRNEQERLIAEEAAEKKNPKTEESVAVIGMPAISPALKRALQSKEARDNYHKAVASANEKAEARKKAMSKDDEEVATLETEILEAEKAIEEKEAAKKEFFDADEELQELEKKADEANESYLIERKKVFEAVSKHVRDRQNIIAEAEKAAAAAKDAAAAEKEEAKTTESK